MAVLVTFHSQWQSGAAIDVATLKWTAQIRICQTNCPAVFYLHLSNRSVCYTGCVSVECYQNRIAPIIQQETTHNAVGVSSNAVANLVKAKYHESGHSPNVPLDRPTMSDWFCHCFACAHQWRIPVTAWQRYCQPQIWEPVQILRFMLFQGEDHHWTIFASYFEPLCAQRFMYE